MEIVNSWQLNLVLSVVFIVLFNHFFKLASRTQKNDGAMTVLVQLISGISILVVIPLFEWKFPTDLKIWFFLGLAVIFYAINDRLHTTTRKNLDVSTENVLRQLYKVLLIVVGIVFFKEEIIIMKIIGGLVIVLSSMLLVMKKGKFVFNKYIILQMISILSFTIALSLDIGISEQFNLPVYISATLVIPAILIMIAERVSFKKVVTEYNEGNRLAIIIVGITWGLSILFGLRAYQFGEITVVAPLSTLSVLFNTMFAYFFLNEKDNLLRKIIATIGVIIGVMLIAYGS